MKPVNLLFLLIGLQGAAWASSPGTYELREGQVELKFVAVGQPSALKIVGTSKALRGSIQLQPKGVAGSIELDLNTLDTGIAMRNEHMKKRYLSTAQWPKALLKLNRVGELKTGSTLSAGALPFDGALSLHGVTRPIQGTIEILAAEGESLPVRANLELKLSDYGIQIPSFAGITVAEQVLVSLDGRVSPTP